MQEKLKSYLQDNRDEIVEGWLTTAPVPNIAESDIDRAYSENTLFRFLNEAMDAILAEVADDAQPLLFVTGGGLRNLLIEIPWCQGNPDAPTCFCSNLCEAGVSAFLTVLDDSWDNSGEFTPIERAEGARLVREVLLRVLGPTNFPCNRPVQTGKTAR